MEKMMIQRTKGNLLEADAEAFVNTVNCVGVMGKGIALQFKRAFPENFKEYSGACKTGQVVLGRMFTHTTSSLSNPKYIINFPTKLHWKNKSRLEDIKSGLENLAQETHRLGIKSIAIPPLGCGAGGLEWKVVGPLIESAFVDAQDVTVILYEPSGAPNVHEMPARTKRPNMTIGRALFIRLMDLYQIPDYSLTLLEIQKLAYFLQCAGEQLRLNFVKHIYGPYAENLNHVLQVMEGHYIVGYGDRSQRAEIHLLPDARETAQAFLMAFDMSVTDRLNRVANLIEGFETPYGMELLASIHWIAMNESKEAMTDPNAAIRGLQGWNSRKRKIFSPNHITKAWERLNRHGWFEQTCSMTRVSESTSVAESAKADRSPCGIPQTT
jgi:O-acetyl-ADP-ribose deacetylase (regulator of RNase III)